MVVMLALALMFLSSGGLATLVSLFYEDVQQTMRIVYPETGDHLSR